MKRYVLIASTNYAGSTVLGLVLGAHTRAAYVGEPAKLLQRQGDGWRHRKFCAACDDRDGVTCPVWSSERVARLRSSPDDFPTLAAAAFGDPPLLIDGSKDLEWYARQRQRLGPAARMIHLTKSVEGYVASVLNRHGGRGRPEFVADDWTHSNRRIRRFQQQHQIATLTLRYEDLAGDLDATLRRLGDFLGFEPEPEQEHFWRGDPHYLKGNPGTATHLDRSRIAAEPGINREIYASRHRTIFVDDKWRRLLSSRALDRLYALPAVRRESEIYGYSHPLGRTGSIPGRLRGAVAERLGRDCRRLVRGLRQQRSAW